MAVINPARLSRPIVTGLPGGMPQSVQGGAQTGEGQEAFLSVLQRQLEQGSKTAFSKHAVSRVAQRQVDVSQLNLQRLDSAVEVARQKGLNAALILIDQSAYIVNAAAGKVITVDSGAEKGSVFTNIDGTVIA